MTDKRIILHPVDETTGELDTNTNLYPKTTAQNVEGIDDKIQEAIADLPTEQEVDSKIAAAIGSAIEGEY